MRAVHDGLEDSTPEAAEARQSLPLSQQPPVGLLGQSASYDYRPLDSCGGRPAHRDDHRWPEPSSSDSMGKDPAICFQQFSPNCRLYRTAKHQPRHALQIIPCPAWDRENPAKDGAPYPETRARIYRYHAKRSKRRNSARGRQRSHRKSSQVGWRVSAPGQAKPLRSRPRPEDDKSADENLAANRNYLLNPVCMMNPFWPRRKKVSYRHSSQLQGTPV
jgi:hypothetical protein